MYFEIGEKSFKVRGPGSGRGSLKALAILIEYMELKGYKNPTVTECSLELLRLKLKEVKMRNANKRAFKLRSLRN